MALKVLCDRILQEGRCMEGIRRIESLAIIVSFDVSPSLLRPVFQSHPVTNSTQR
jgi:hypothetical protein